jgi:hypothetical protein
MATVMQKVEIDLSVDPKPLTKEEIKSISDFIKSDKKKLSSQKRQRS